MWWTIYRIADGACLGHTSVLPDTLPPGSATVTHADRQDQGIGYGAFWDPINLVWTPRPAPVMVDRLQDLANHPYAAEVWQRLTPAQRVKLRRILVWLLGGQRLRRETDPVAIDEPSGWPTDPSGVVE